MKPPQPNHPSLWLAQMPRPAADGHKYRRGALFIAAGPRRCTGASVLAARAAQRAGAGLVLLAAPEDAHGIYAASLHSIMALPYADEAGFAACLRAKPFRAVLAGPGMGTGAAEMARLNLLLEAGLPTLLDADALTLFAGRASTLAARLKAPAVITPHEGEFARLFPDLRGAREARALAAAKKLGAVVALKGSQTLIAAPDGRLALNPAASPWLATAGTGDVLAGFIAALLAQHMPAFEAACAGVWLHSRAAHHAGIGLIADDLIGYTQASLTDLWRHHEKIAG